MDDPDGRQVQIADDHASTLSRLAFLVRTRGCRIRDA
jgi:hypothetical protein